ncbi:protein of unknown function [Nitrospira japonica]|uniref:Uncharacterized protein n=1 Tax=Nitrospira japonica TaxID=1325564 RepID=A0A1W1I0X4_9BACT|nr:protein of unknown function [Nitrospira japonica]
MKDDIFQGVPEGSLVGRRGGLMDPVPACRYGVGGQRSGSFGTLAGGLRSGITGAALSAQEALGHPGTGDRLRS